MKTKKTNLKPVEHDVHLKYLCPVCNEVHWLSLNEAKTKNFTVVCECGEAFRVKRVSQIKLDYAKRKIQKEKQSIPLDLLDRSVKILIPYGFTKEEASSMLSESYSKNPIENILLLIKQTLENLGEKNVNEHNQTDKI
jgi:transcription elongation factor Elf1